MTSKEIDKYNAAYLGIPMEWMSMYNNFISMPMNQWPQSLVDFCTEVTNRIGWCGDVAACAVADWMKEEKAAGCL